MSIRLTVAMPLYRAKHIAWLAMESLCRQRDIDFEWELIISQEMDQPEVFDIQGYRERLLDRGCVRVHHHTLSEWMPLGNKWALMGQAADEDSEVFLPTSGKCTTPLRGLRQRLEAHKKNDADWIDMTKGAYYEIVTEKAVLVDKRSHLDMPRPVERPAMLFPTMRTDLVRDLPMDNVWNCVDMWLFREARKRKKGFRYRYDNTGWKEYLNTYGINNITDKNRYFTEDGWTSRGGYVTRLEPWSLDYVEVADDLKQRLKGVKQHVRRPWGVI